MPPRSRRALLAMLGSGSAGLLAGCQIDSGTQTTTKGTTTTTQTETTTSTTTETETESETTTETAGEVDCAPVSRPDAAWPVPRRSPALDSYVADPQGFDDSPALAWEAHPSRHDEEYATPLYGQPIVAGDTVYLTNELNQGPQVATFGHVHALAVESGDRQWSSGKLRSPSVPAVWGNRVVNVAENEDLEAMVIALDPVEGGREWTREFGARKSGYVTAGDHLYLALEEGTGLGTVRALADDGSTVWSRESALEDHVNVGPVAGTDTVYITTRKGRLHALARDDGSADWSHRFEHPTEPRPYITDLVATDCGVFVVVEGAVNAFDVTGTPVWEVEGDFGTLATDGETIYAATDSDGGREFRAMDAATGETLWRVGDSFVLYGSPIIAGDAVYLATDDSIVALELADGTERWRRERGHLGDLALAHGTLYGITEGNLLALE